MPPRLITRDPLILVVVCAGWATGLFAQAPITRSEDKELRLHLEAISTKLDEPGLDVVSRARLAMEIATTLDRAATAATNAGQRRERWEEAARVLDNFTAKNPGHPLASIYNVQSGVYLWARARTWLQALEINPKDGQARSSAITELSACVERFRKALTELPAGASDAYAQNVRYRSSQTLADLASLLDETTAREWNAAARKILEAKITEASLAGHAELLRATLDTRLGDFNGAEEDLKLASAANPPLSALEILDARVGLEVAQGKYDEALQAIGAAAVDPASKPPARIQVRLAQRSGTANAAKRNEAEAAVFRDLRLISESQRPDARAARMAVALKVVEPDDQEPPESWELLAAGAARLGELERAGALAEKGAALADAASRAGVAAEYRLRAGAYFFQAENFARADALIRKVRDDPQAGALRPKAGMLLALSLGRALATKQPGAGTAAYTSALEDQIKNFGGDSSASEARWLLGKLRLAESDSAAAIKLWGEIPRGDPRWSDSKTQVATLRQQEIDDNRLVSDRNALDRLMREARAELSESLKVAVGDQETIPLLLASARLELTPGIGRPEDAAKALERIQRSAALPEQRDQARRLNILALAYANRWVDVEQAARAEAAHSDFLELLPLIRLVDRAAAEADSDLRARRFGYLGLLLLAPVIQNHDTIQPVELAAEVNLRRARALLFSGDGPGARRILASKGGALPTTGDENLRDLAELYARLEAYSLAVDVQRLRARSLSPGSPLWFDARYGLALASYRAGKPKDAAQLIDGTAILHPNLGGGDLREKFLRLRQRIGPDQD